MPSRPRSWLAALTAACGTAAFAALLALAAGPGRPGPTTAVAAPQAQEAPAPVTVTLYSSELAWRTTPHHWVAVDVAHVEGFRDDGHGNLIGQRSHGYGRADGHGNVVARLRLSGDSTGGRFRPFDVLTLTHSTFTATMGTPHVVHVPELRVDVAPGGDAIVGRAAPGTAVSLAIDAAGDGTAPPVEATVVADAAGAFAWAVPGGERLAPGAGGWATISDGAGNRFRARFAAFSLRVYMGSNRASGWLTPASALTATITAALPDGGLARGMLSLHAGARIDGRREQTHRGGLVIELGTLLTATVGSPIVGTREVAADPVPPLSVDQLAATFAAGSGPPGGTATLEIYPPDTDAWAVPIVRLPVAVGDDGRWRADVPPGTVPAGGRVAIVVALGQAIDVAAEAVRPRFSIAIDGARVAAELTPGTRYRLTAIAADGSVIGRTGFIPDGRDARLTRSYDLEAPPNLPEGALSVVVRGGSLEVDYGEGSDPERIAIPELSAVSDADADAFHGTAPPGARLAVEVLHGETRTVHDVTAAPDGSWELPLAGQVDVATGVGARAWYTDEAGHRLYVDTAPVRIVASPNYTHLSAAPWTGRPYRAEVRDAAGRVVAAASSFADQGPTDDERHLALGILVGDWLADIFRQRPAMLPGDAIWVQIGDDEATWVLPPLEGWIDPDQDLVVGQTKPGVRVAVIAGELDDPLSVVVSSTAGLDGRFHADFGGRFDIPYSGFVHVRLDDGPHRLERSIPAPRLVIDYERATVSGVVEPHVDVLVRLLESARVRAEGRAKAAASGGFSVLIRDPDGLPIVPREGERIEVSAPDAELVRAMELILPPLHMELAPDRRSLSGPRPIDAYVSGSDGPISMRWPDGDFYGGVFATFTMTETGRWRIGFSGPLPPGRPLQVSAGLYSGHLLRRSHIEPMLAVENGGARACGVAMPFADVDLELTAADGSRRAVHHATASIDGLFSLGWQDADGRPVSTEPFDRIVGRVGEAAIDIPIDPLTATIDLADGLLHAQIRPGAHPVVTAPARSCLFDLSAEDARYLDASWLRPQERDYGLRPVPESGLIRLSLLDPELLARGMDLYYETADEHRQFRTVYRPLRLAADVATGELRGQALPGARVTASLYEPGGGPIASGEATADHTGAFAMPFERGQLAAGVRVEAEAVAGALVSLAPSAVVTAAMTVEPLDLDPSRTALLGQAPPGRTVELTMDVEGIGERWIALRAGDDGRFALRAADLPARNGWTLGDVVAGRAELFQPNGHRTVASWIAQQAEPIPRTLYLPLGLAQAAIGR